VFRFHGGSAWRESPFAIPAVGEPALRDVSLTIEAGSVTALVGENGSGKTTLAALLCGLHLPTEGRVRRDGVGTSALDPGQLYARTAVVFQDFLRYRLTARDNVDLADARTGTGTGTGQAKYWRPAITSRCWRLAGSIASPSRCRRTRTAQFLIRSRPSVPRSWTFTLDHGETYRLVPESPQLFP
jgi:ABC-type thiamine transport system ATPase subunit